jgi:Zn-dependent protease
LKEIAVLLYEPDATPFDLRFRVWRTYVRVHPFFWLITAMLGWPYTQSPRPMLPGGGFGDLALWMFCCFVSVLLHELGHIWMGQFFGSDGHIVLHGMGGLAIGAANVARSWQRILVSFAGPGIELLLAGLLLGLIGLGVIPVQMSWTFPFIDFPYSTSWELMLRMLLWINLLWALVNLLPIWPLDGGQITREVAQNVSPRQGVVVALWISLILSAVLALHCLLASRRMGGHGFIPYLEGMGSIWNAILFALFAVGSWQALQVETSRRRRHWDDDVPWER